ncbi:MAG: rhomboid family intramembrane serine protease [Lachnospiraceae bacterium]|nr:rhomboid family intramembrane serine protease [Lachnospiraceae bacterium]
MDENRDRTEYRPVVTIILIVLNVLAFGIQTISGGSESTSVLVKLGASYTPYIVEDGQWYRLFTPMFLHIGVEHLAMNMLALFATGQYVEQYFGRVRFILLYILSGIAGNALTLFSELFLTHRFVVSAGASGAISGLFGAIVILAIDPRTRKYFPLPRVLLGLLFLILPSGAKDINIVAHLGGMICGFVLAFCFYMMTPLHRQRQCSDSESDSESEPPVQI